METSNEPVAPSLVEPGVKYFLTDALRKTHENKMKSYSLILNIVIGFVFFAIFGGFLYYRYKSKPTPLEIKQKLAMEEAIIMSKIHSYQDDRKRATYSNITNLPFVDMDYYVKEN